MASVGPGAIASSTRASTNPGTSPQARSSPTTAQPLPVTPTVRAGQPFVTPGHQAPQGPLGLNPPTAHGIQLSVLSGLLHGQPTFNGDFADPFALLVGDSVFAYATTTTGGARLAPAHIPVMAITRPTGFAGHTTVPGSFSDESSASAVRDGEVACADLATQESAARIDRSLARRDLTPFESDVLSEFAAEYPSPSEVPQCTSNMQQALLQAP